MLYCKACRRTMIHNFATKKAKHYRYYVCSTVLRNGGSKCPTGSLPAAEIERVVVEQIARIAEDRDLQREVLRQARAHHDAEIAALAAERTALDRELARHHAEIRKLATKGPASSATTGRIADLHERVGTAEERHREVGATLAELQAERIEEADVVAAFGRFDAVWNALSKREQAAIMSLLLSRVEFDADASTVLAVNHRHLASVATIRQIGAWPAWCQVVHGGNAFNHAYLGRKTEVDPDEFFDRIRVSQPEPSCLYDRVRARFRRYRGNNFCLTREKWNAIEPLLRPDMRTLELACGLTTHLFTEIVRDHTAIEHDPRWYKLCLQGCKANLIHAPLVGAPPWYDVDPHSLGKFDLILIDGPPGNIGREGVLTRIEALAHEATVIVVDDVNRLAERRIVEMLRTSFNLVTLS